MGSTDRTFLVECYLPGSRAAEVAEAGRRAEAVCVAWTARGTSVAYLGATLVAADEVVFHAFRAADAATVEAASREAALQFERVVESMDVPASQAPASGPIAGGDVLARSRGSGSRPARAGG